MQIEKIPALFTPIQITLETREEAEYLREFLGVAEVKMIAYEETHNYYPHTPKRSFMVSLSDGLSCLLDGEEDESGLD